MSTVIAFPDRRTAPPRRRTARRRDEVQGQIGVGQEAAEVIILPVVRVERHASELPGPAPQAGFGRVR